MMTLKRGYLCLGFGLLSLGLWAQNEKKEFDYGLRLYGEGLYDVAALQFEQFLQNYPQSPLGGRVAFLLGESLFKQNQFQEAKQAYWTLLVRYPNAPEAAEAQYRFGECVEKIGETEAAIQAYQRIALFFPESPFAAKGLFRAARLALGAGRLAEAESHVKALIQSAPPQDMRSRASLLLSDVLAAGNRFSEAEAVLRPLIDQPAALFRLSRLEIQQGAFEKAEKHLESLLQKSKDDSLLQVARFLMADLLVFQAKIDPALNHYRLVAKGPDLSLQRRAYLRIGDLEISRNRFDYALASYQSLADLSPADTLFARMAIGKARAQYGLGRFSAAKETLHPILTGAGSSEADRKEARLLYARILLDEKSDAAALAQYLDIFHENPKDPLAPWALLQAARIEIERLNHVTAGLFHLQTLWERYPTHRLVPEARYRYALGLEKVRRFEEARQVLTDMIRQYPGNPWAEIVSHRLNWVYGLQPKRALFPQRMGFLPLLFGDYLAGTWFDFLAAIDAYRQADLTEDSVAFRIGRSYGALFFLDQNPAWKDSAIAFFRRQIGQGVSSPEDLLAELFLIELEGFPPSDCLRRYRRLERQVSTDLHDRFVLHWGRVALACDSIDRALTVFSRSRDPEADFWTARAWYRKGDVRKAAERLDRYLSRDATLYTPEALLIRARCHASQGDDSLAIPLLERLLDRYGYSDTADSAALFLGGLYLRKNRPQAAIRLYQAWIAREQEAEEATKAGWKEKGTSLLPEAFFGLGRGFETERRYPEAKSAYFEVLRRNPNALLKNQVLKALSRIAEAEGHFGKAAEYEEATSSSDSSLYRIGRLKMKEKAYEAAARTLMAAINAGPAPGLSLLIYRDLAISFLRLGQISQAESARLALEKKHAKVPGVEEALAEVEIEKGMAYLEQKEFTMALECFDRVKKKWKRGPWAVRADLETGRVLLIMNQTEKALDLLTKMALQYQNDPIIDRVYLNLGDHYFRSQQFENALEAFRKVVESRKDPEIRPLGMRYLIRVYETLGLFDAAIALTRQYLSEYPDAEDALQKKVQIGLNAMQLKAYDLALAQFRSVQWEADSETEAEIQYWIGKCFADMGRSLEAIREFLKVKYVSKPTRLPWASTALFEAARIYERLSEPGRALSLYEKIVQAEGRTSDLGRVAQQKINELTRRP